MWLNYKTGQFSKGKKKFNPPDPAAVMPSETEASDSGKEMPPQGRHDNGTNPDREKLHGGDYWRQAVFYKILVDNDPTRSWNVISTEFDFVEPDSKTKEYHRQKVVISPHDIDLVKAQIKAVHEGIMNLEFSRGCNEPYCKWCNFVKSNYMEMTGEEVEDI